MGTHQHQHQHQHPHQHDHGHDHETLAPAASCASVAIEVGGGHGALVLYPSERFRDLESEISPAPGEGPRVHTGVHARTTASRARLTAIFGSLPEGEYAIWEDEVTPGPLVAIRGGLIVELVLD